MHKRMRITHSLLVVEFVACTHAGFRESLVSVRSCFGKIGQANSLLWNSFDAHDILAALHAAEPRIAFSKTTITGTTRCVLDDFREAGRAALRENEKDYETAWAAALHRACTCRCTWSAWGTPAAGSRADHRWPLEPTLDPAAVMAAVGVARWRGELASASSLLRQG